MNIQQLINIEALAPIELVAGTAHTKAIKTVTMMDTPNIIPCLLPQELIITTAYHLQHNDDFFIDLIEAMARIAGAGIGIKLNRFLTEIPPAVIAAANEWDVPLLVLPETLSLGEMNYVITEHILKSETILLNEAMEVQRRLMDLLMKGHQLPRLVRELERVLGLPIHLFTPYLKPFNPAYTNEPLATALVPHMPETSFSVVDTKTHYTSFHIPTKHDAPYRLIVESLPLPMSASHQFIIHQALQVFGFALLQHELLEQQRYTLHNNEWQHLLRIQRDQPLPSQTATWQMESGFICMYGYAPSSFNVHVKPYQLQQMLTRFVEDQRLPMQVFMEDHHIVLLYAVKEVTVDATTFLKEMLLAMSQQLQRFFGLAYQFGVSNPAPTMYEVKRAYEEAKTTAVAGAPHTVRFHKRKTIVELFEMIPNNDLIRYAQMTFQPFQHLNEEEQEILLDTLHTYLETHCQISDTAKQLYVHRNTVLYRLNKCSTLLQKDLKDPEVTMQLRLALRIRKTLPQTT